MLKTISELFSLLTPFQRKRFYILQVFVIITAFTELLAIASIAPFMAIVGDVGLLEKDNLFAKLFLMSGLDNSNEFLLYTGGAVLLTLTLSTIVSMFSTWKLSVYGAKIGTEIADRLYAHYIHQNWLFHASGSSAHLVNQVASEAMRVTEGIIQPLLQINAKAVLTVFILLSILIYDPLVAMAGLLLFVGLYFLLYKLVHRKLVQNGRNVSLVYTQRFRLMNEGFGGIKDVLILNRSDDFTSKFSASGKVLADARGNNRAMSQVPRYFMELMALGSMIGLVLLLIKLHHGDLGAVLPILAVYTLAALKLLPALQQIYANISDVKGNISAFESLKNDLVNSKCTEKSDNVNTQQKEQIKYLYAHNNISLTNVTFAYNHKHTPAVDNLTLVIPANKVVGLVGPSGAGKSTTIDLLLGLLTPQQGCLSIDNTVITEQNKRHWQNTIGFVPQSIFLSEGTIAENVAFGISETNIDIKQVNKALDLAHLTDFVKQLPNGINTKVGERGVQLSGGQRQRIGIARALYNEANILVFDEATNALDGITEKTIMDAIHDFGGQKTIIMIAHRLKTVQQCDIIYYMEQGKVIDQGTYDQLILRNANFKEMAQYA